jgi:hypothetical protein
MEWSLDGPLPKLCPVNPISNQDDPNMGSMSMNIQTTDLLLVNAISFYRENGICVVLKNKNVGIKFSACDVFLEWLIFLVYIRIR